MADRTQSLTSFLIVYLAGCCCYIVSCEEFCSDERVHHTCSVNSMALNVKILDHNGNQIGMDVSITVADSTEPPPIGDFEFLNITSSPNLSIVISTIARLNISGYTIVCEDPSANLAIISSLTIEVLDSTPGDIKIHTDTFTNSSVDISWTESSSPCVTGYRYNVSSTAPGWVNIIMESTNNSVTVEGLVPSDNQYCVVVTAIEQYSTSRESNQSCFILNVPKLSNDLVVTVEQPAISINVSVTVSWKQNILASDIAVPDLKSYQVVINNWKGFSKESELLPAVSVSHTFNSIPSGEEYNITLIAINGVGSAFVSVSTNIEVKGTSFLSPLASMFPSSSLHNTTIATTSDTQSNTSDSVTQSTTADDTFNNISLIAGLTVPLGLLVVAMLVLLIIVIIVVIKKTRCRPENLTKKN